MRRRQPKLARSAGARSYAGVADEVVPVRFTSKANAHLALLCLREKNSTAQAVSPLPVPTSPPGCPAKPLGAPLVRLRAAYDECVAARHSITSSARTRIDGGTARPRAVAVLRFTTISNFVGGGATVGAYLVSLGAAATGRGGLLRDVPRGSLNLPVRVSANNLPVATQAQRP
jgi:hypothetical protein